MSTANVGNTSIVEGPINITYTPGKGGTTRRTFTGNAALILAEARVLQAIGYQTDITGGPLWTLTATLSGEQDQTPEPVWEIVGHALERSVLECSDRPIVANLSASTKALIEYSIKNPTTSEPLVENEDDIAQIDNAFIVYNMMRAGVESRQEFTISVRRTIVVSRNYSADWALGNVGKVLSKETLVGFYNIPAFVSVLLPEGSSSVEYLSGIYTFKGYLEQYPTYQSIQGNKIQIAQEWLFNKWSAGENGLYDVA